MSHAQSLFRGLFRKQVELKQIILFVNIELNKPKLRLDIASLIRFAIGFRLKTPQKSIYVKDFGPTL